MYMCMCMYMYVQRTYIGKTDAPSQRRECGAAREGCGKRRKQNQDGSSPSAKAREAREAGAAWRPGKALAQLGRRGWARLGRERGTRPSRKKAKRCLCDAG